VPDTPYTEQDSFPDQFAALAGGGNIGYTYTYTNGTLPKTFKNNDVDGFLYFNIEYYGFGTTDSKGIRWNIRNGIDFRIDNNKLGRVISVVVGAGGGASDALVRVDHPF
jgi:hypothetical protein